MTDPVTASLSAHLKALRSKLKESITGSSPEAEFARFVFESAGSVVPFDSPPPVSDAAELRRGRAPKVAAAGYRLTMHSSIVVPWREGFQRLMGTNPFPHDRMSFAYRAADLIGLALGARSLDDERGTSWLRDVVQRRVREERTSAWPELMYLIAAEAVGLPVTLPTTTAPTPDLDLRLLGFIRWWSAWCGVVEPHDRARQVDEALLNHLLLAEPDNLDVPGMAVVLQAGAAAVNRRVAWFVSSSEAGVPDSGGSLGVLVTILRRFHVAVQQLQRRHGGRDPFPVNDEYDAQDLLHAVLKFHFDDVRPEEWTPSYGGRSSRMDFLLKPERIVVEVKMTRDRLGQKELTQELVIDKEHYRAHPECEALVCFVYDPANRCTNPMALESDLSRTDDSFMVFVVVAPTGR